MNAFLIVIVIASVVNVYASCVDVMSTVQPRVDFKAAVARWLLHHASYGTLSTVSKEFDGTPFGNTVSFADGMFENATSGIYLKKSGLDQSMKDIDNDNRCSLSVTAQDIYGGYCTARNIDPEDPRCTRITLVGKLVEVLVPDEKEYAQAELELRHPQVAHWNQTGHEWKLYRMDYDVAWLLDYFGGSVRLKPQDLEGVEVCRTDLDLDRIPNAEPPTAHMEVVTSPISVLSLVLGSAVCFVIAAASALVTGCMTRKYYQSKPMVGSAHTSTYGTA